MGLGHFSSLHGFPGFLVDDLKMYVGVLEIEVARMPTKDRDLFNILLKKLWPDMEQDEIDGLYKVRERAHKKKDEDVGALSENLELFRGVLNEEDFVAVEEIVKTHRAHLAAAARDMVRPTQAGLRTAMRGDSIP